MNTLDIANAIKKARIDAGFTQAQVAEALGITYQAVSNYERGKTRIDTGTLKKLCDLYNISVLEIFGADNKNPAEDNFDGLSKAEASLIKLFRLVPEKDQEMVLQMIEVALRSKGLL